MFGILKGSDAAAIKELESLYIKYSKLDGKPEKGERKMADDYVLIIDEVLAEEADKESRTDGHLSTTDLYRIGLLEYAMSLSPDNFDI